MRFPHQPASAPTSRQPSADTIEALGAADHLTPPPPVIGRQQGGTGRHFFLACYLPALLEIFSSPISQLSGIRPVLINRVEFARNGARRFPEQGGFRKNRDGRNAEISTVLRKSSQSCRAPASLHAAQFRAWLDRSCASRSSACGRAFESDRLQAGNWFAQRRGGAGSRDRSSRCVGLFDRIQQRHASAPAARISSFALKPESPAGIFHTPSLVRGGGKPRRLPEARRAVRCPPTRLPR